MELKRNITDMRQTQRLKDQVNYSELPTRGFTENGTRLNIHKGKV